MNLSDFVGLHIQIMAPDLHSEQIEIVKLLGVEAGGIWIESQMLTEDMLRRHNAAAMPMTIGFFLPYNKISFICAATEGISLDEKAFGL